MNSILKPHLPSLLSCRRGGVLLCRTPSPEGEGEKGMRFLK
jgi:hypothetical protein